MAPPTGFEPVISGVTSQRVGPLRYGGVVQRNSGLLKVTVRNSTHRRGQKLRCGGVSKIAVPALDRNHSCPSGCFGRGSRYGSPELQN